MLDKTGLKAYPNRIFNANETSFLLCGRPQMVVTHRGGKSPQFIVGGTGKENITVHAMCFGFWYPLTSIYFVYWAASMMNYTQSGPVGSRYGVSNKGWMNEVNFLDWFQKLCCFWWKLEHICYIIWNYIKIDGMIKNKHSKWS